MDSSKQAQRAVIQFLSTEGVSGTDIHNRMKNVYGPDCMSRTAVFRWCSDFRHGRVSTADLPRPGQARVVITQKSIAAVNSLVRENRQITTREIADSLCVSKGTVNTILHEHLQYSKNCMDILNSEPGPCQMSSDDENEFIGIKVEDVTDIKMEEDPFPSTSAGIKTEPADCLDVLRGDHESYAETCSTSSGDGKQFDFVSVDDTVIKQEEDPEPTTSTRVRNDPLNCLNVLRSDSGSCSETYLTSLDDEKWDVDIKEEEVTDAEDELNPQPILFKTITVEPENTVNGQLCTCSGNCATSCNACNKSFVPRIKVVTHKQVHVGEEPLSCDACGKVFSQQSDLMEHKQIHNGERPYSCDDTNKLFIQQNDLMKPKHIHSGERPYSCDVCNKAFILQSTLKEHKQIHCREQLFSCVVCNKTFVQKFRLMKHMHIHGGVRPFLCDVCGRAFRRKSSLVKHKHMHSADRPFPCDVCDKAFVYQSDLVIHRRVHSGERPFSCDICDKAFVHRGHLMRHKRLHGKKQPFYCEVCHKPFIRRVDLLQHRQIHKRAAILV